MRSGTMRRWRSFMGDFMVGVGFGGGVELGKGSRLTINSYTPAPRSSANNCRFAGFSSRGGGFGGGRRAGGGATAAGHFPKRPGQALRSQPERFPLYRTGQGPADAGVSAAHFAGSRHAARALGGPGREKSGVHAAGRRVRRGRGVSSGKWGGCRWDGASARNSGPRALPEKARSADLNAPQSQAPRSASRKRHGKPRRFGATALSFSRTGEIRGFGIGPGAFVCRKS